MNLCLDPQVRRSRTAHSLVPIRGHEQPHSPPEDMRGIDQNLRALTSARRHLGALLTEFTCANKPKFTGHLHCPSGTPWRRLRNALARAMTLLGAPVWRICASCRRRYAESVIGLSRRR